MSLEPMEPVNQNLNVPDTPQIISDALKGWYDATGRKEVTLVTAGRSGAGKSTMIRNMLGLPLMREDSPQHETRVYTAMAGDVEVKFIDTPGFGRSDDSDIKILAELQEKTGGKADILLYCVSLLPDYEFSINTRLNQETEIVQRFTRVFCHGSEIFQYMILVLTFADTVRTHYPNTTVENLVEFYASRFQSMINYCPFIQPIFKFGQRHSPHRTTVIAMPAGFNRTEVLMQGMRWDESIYMEVRNKCNNIIVPSLFEVRKPRSWIAMRALKMIGHPMAAVLAGISGAVVGIVPGAYVGGMVNMLGIMIMDLFRGYHHDDSGISAGVKGGAVIGLFFGGMLAFFWMNKRNESVMKHQIELEKIQEASNHIRGCV